MSNKRSLNKFTKFRALQNVFSSHTAITETERSVENVIWQLRSILNNKWVKNK